VNRSRNGAVLLLAALAAGCAAREPVAPAHHNILIYLVDALRADHLGCYGYARPVSPVIDALAAGGVRFENAVAHSSWTRPSVASILTGLTPLEHGVRRRADRLADELETLPEILRAAGWSTAAFSPNPHVSSATGFGQGFDHFEMFLDDPRAQRLAERVLAWLVGGGGLGAPWFVYAHALDPHGPYLPPADLRQRFAATVSRPGAGTREDIVATMRTRFRDRAGLVRDLRDLYDAEIADTDRGLGLLLEGLRQRRQLDNTLIVLLADHGEGFDEHRLLTHGNSLYAELVDIPLIFKLPPPGPARRDDSLARQIDVLPTILAALRLPAPAAAHGRDLFAEQPAVPPAAILDLLYERHRGAGLVTGDWKYLHGRSRQFGRGEMLFSRRADRLDATDLGDREPERRAAMSALLERELRRQGPLPPQAAIDAEGEAALRALGYL
jgi:arylsulfatase A-like enzyme